MAASPSKHATQGQGAAAQSGNATSHQHNPGITLANASGAVRSALRAARVCLCRPRWVFERQANPADTPVGEHLAISELPKEDSELSLGSWATEQFSGKAPRDFADFSLLWAAPHRASVPRRGSHLSRTCSRRRCER